MTGVAGTVRNGELWLRCPYCGDSSKDQRKAHYSVNRDGLFHCVRCKAGGRLPLRDYLTLLSSGALSGLRSRGVGDDDDWEDYLDELIPGPGTERRSALDRFHLRGRSGETPDVFLSRDLAGDIIGVAIAHGKRRTLQGARGYGYTGPELVSSAESPIRLVEGPYDVLSDRDVCLFGLPSPAAVRKLRGHFVILCPDGDVWSDFTKRNTIIKTLLTKNGPEWVGVEYLRDGEDPDDVPYEKRRMVDPRKVVSRWRKDLRAKRWRVLSES